MGLGGEGGSCVRSMVQRLVVGDLVPVRIVKKKFKFFYIADGFIL
jgi:hypothetical protein